MVLSLLVYISLAYLICQNKNWHIKHEQMKLWAICFIGYSIVLLISHSYIDNPFTDYFISYDQAGFFYPSAYKLKDLSFSEIFHRSFSVNRYSELPLAVSYFASLMKIGEFLQCKDLLLFLKFNCTFFGSLISVLIYKSIIIYTENKYLVRDILIFAFLSPLMFLSVQLLRDIFICFLFVLLFYLVVKPKQIFRIPIIIAVIVIIFFLRKESGLFALCFLAAFLYRTYIAGNASKKIFALVIVIIGISIIGGLVLQTMSSTIYSYELRSIEMASNDSLAVKLHSLPFPLDILSITIFGQLLPFPIWLPLSGQEPYTWMRSIECFFPYYWVPILICVTTISLKFNNHTHKLLQFLLIISFLYIIIVSAADINTRRLCAVYPLIFIIYYIYQKPKTIDINRIYYFTAILMLVLNIVYYAVKF